MHRIVCWRSILPFAKLCLILVLVALLERGPTTLGSVPLPGGAHPGEAAVGWDVRCCWDCDNIGPLPRLLFLGIFGLFFWVGGQLDRLTGQIGRLQPKPARPVALLAPPLPQSIGART